MTEKLTAKQYAARIVVPHGTIKRWRMEGLPGSINSSRQHLEIDPTEADEWVNQHKAHSISFHRGSFIYIARREDGALKIGWTADTLRRFAELRRESGQNVTPVALFPGDKSDELRLHARFAAHRLDGEWFSPCADLDSYLASFRNFVQ